MVGGAILPERLVANMYVTLYGYQTYTLTLNLPRDLKLVPLPLCTALYFNNGHVLRGQYTKLPPSPYHIYGPSDRPGCCGPLFV